MEGSGKQTVEMELQGLYEVKEAKEVKEMKEMKETREMNTKTKLAMWLCSLSRRCQRLKKNSRTT